MDVKQGRSFILFLLNDIVDVFALYGAIRVGRLAWRRWHNVHSRST
jgi:hypothetical protein